MTTKITHDSPARRLRIEAGISQAELARRLGVTQPAVAQYEAAGDNIRVRTLLKIAKACDSGRAEDGSA